MLIIIRGWNRAEFCYVSSKNKEKHFFKTSNKQLYKIYPDGFMRMKCYKNGLAQESEEVMIYRENEIIPYHTRHLNYNMDKMLADIDEHKMLKSRGLLSDNPWIVNSGKSLWKFATSTGGIIVIVLAYAILAGGH